MRSKKSLNSNVTVIIPCYNSGFSILRTLQSLRSQTYKNFSIIIINDGSNDLVTLKILKNIFDKNVRIIHQKNAGLASARNTGILNCSTEFILPLDADDWLASNALETFTLFLKKKKKYDYVYSNIVNQDQSTGSLKKHYNYFEQLFSNQIPYSIFIRTDILKKVGMYDLAMKNGFEDWELNLRLGKKGYVGHCLNKDLFFYNVSNEGMLKKISIKNFAYIYGYIRKKHKDLFKFYSLLKHYKKYWNKKSSHILFFYFFFNIFYFISSNKIFNSTLEFFIKNFSKTAKIDKLKKKELINKKFKINKIVHIITSLDIGGAEKALVSLLTELKKNKKNFIPTVVICLKDKGYYYNHIKNLKIKIYCLNMLPNKINFFKQYILYKIVKNENPDIIQTWMYHSDLVGGMAALLANVKIKIWTIHNYNISIKALGLQTRLVVFLCSILSHFLPTKIISVSKAAIEKHKQIGFNSKKFIHVPLGYKKSKNLKIGKSNTSKVRKIIFGSISRWNVQKNHKFMLESFGKFKKKGYKNFMIYLAGKELNYNNKELLKIIKDNDLNKEVVLFDWIEDTSSFLAKIDVHVLTSIGEAFPNVICEAMLSRIPCISTNVGDVVNIIGPTGWIFEVNNYIGLENILISIFQEIDDDNIWNIRKKIARERIVNNFGIDLMMQNYYQVWKPSSKNEARMLEL